MKQQYRKFFLAIVISIVYLACAGIVLAQKEEPVFIKVPLAYPSGLPGLGTSIKYLAEKAPIISDGSVNFKIYEPGKLIPAFEMLGAVDKQVVEACYGVSGYWSGKVGNGLNFFTAVPFGPEAAEYLAWIYNGNGLKLWQEIYDSKGFNVKVFPCGIMSPESSGWYTKEIKSVADYKGLPIRFFGLGGQVLTKLGASVQQIPGGEIFGALEKGVIEGSEFSMPAIDTKLGFYKVAKFNYFPGWHQQATYLELLINKDVWNSLNPKQQMVIEELCKSATLSNLAYCESIQAPVMKENVASHGVKNIKWSDEMLDTFESAWMEVVKEESVKDPMFKKIWDDLAAFRAEYKTWSDYGFLPRK
ncbi:MAG: TRAP transporter substrate-binding protein [Proteobacteria bacterium]|nr:TRAP transporter substrate-binding protein [Pseudomonadota bacterium]MBU1582016.1 TRAP transporter substrate-binding protein [Pseudomonadota bacterium]MBU2456258.1 TRAP transporter substrate-binding protein [Pseudomonadota bacterium]MBU2630628.1 TRAP transporter substrate-binding protein [Pseudomonadota bacterium]